MLTSKIDYEEVKNLFAAVFELQPEQRGEYFNKIGADESLIAEVSSLLDACAESEEFLNNVSAATSVRDSFSRHDHFLGRKIGSYRIEREIGRGGMGVVFLARREDFNQRVAVKLIKRGMDSDAILTRFRREREILAALDHPFVARLSDGGTTDDDLPFFVMEYVEGVPVDEYCRTENLSEKEKLELFRKICEALSFAHQKLIVHRDLKPSNILITKNGTPKLLDFGIAKLLDSTTAETQTNLRVLTPAYASPEQIRGAAVDTTSDVYSLGKILAELLLGETFKSVNFQIGENQFPKITKQKFGGDVQNILAMSLREDPARRYNSVEKFSEDIRRYLNGLPITARRDTVSYRAAKFLKRNCLAAAAASLFVLTLLTGSAVTLWQAREATRAREIAERRLENLRKMSNLFTTEIHGAIENLPGSLPARQMLMRHAVEQLDALAAESGDNLALLDELAQAYLNSTQLPDMTLTEKDETLRKSIAIYRRLIADDPNNIHYQEQTANAYDALGDITKVRGSVKEAIEFGSAGAAMLERVAESEPQSIEHLVNLAYVYLNTAALYNLKDDTEANLKLSAKIQSAIEKIETLNPNEPELKQLVLQSKMLVCRNQKNTGNYQPAIATLNEIFADYKAQAAKSESDTRAGYNLWAVNRRLADTLEASGDLPSAAKHWRKALTIMENLLAGSPKDFGYHRNAAATHILYGESLMRQKQSAAALEHFRRAVELSDFVVAGDTENYEAKFDQARAIADLGIALVLTGKKAEGVEDLQKGFAALQEISARDAENAETKRAFLQTGEWLNTIQ